MHGLLERIDYWVVGSILIGFPCTEILYHHHYQQPWLSMSMIIQTVFHAKHTPSCAHCYWAVRCGALWTPCTSVSSCPRASWSEHWAWGSWVTDHRKIWRKQKNRKLFCWMRCWKWSFPCLIHTQRRLLYGGEDRVLFSKEHKGVFFITKQFHLLSGWRSGKQRDK